MEFEQVVEQYSEALYYTAYIYVRNKQAAEDIVQDVFITYYKKQQQFRGEASLKTYLTRMIINRCYDYESSWKNKAKVWIDQLHITSNEIVDELVEQRTVNSSLLEAIRQLKPKYREVVILYYFEEYLIRQIADILQCSENTVHTRLKRAKAQLKSELTEEVLGYEA